VFRGAFEILYAKLFGVPTKRSGYRANRLLTSFRICQTAKLGPSLGFGDDDSVKAYCLWGQGCRKQIVSNFDKHRFKLARSRLKLMDRRKPSVDQIAQYSIEQIIFIAVPRIHSSLGYAGRVSHGLDRGAVEAQFHEHFACDLHQVLVSPRGLGLGRPTATIRGPM
jgi:hypothetical protein